MAMVAGIFYASILAVVASICATVWTLDWRFAVITVVLFVNCWFWQTVVERVAGRLP
jgi:hypothetical protein